jgi:hypothetical protein
MARRTVGVRIFLRVQPALCLSFFSNLFAAPFGVVPLAISLSASVLVNGRQRGE